MSSVEEAWDEEAVIVMSVLEYEVSVADASIDEASTEDAASVDELVEASVVYAVADAGEADTY